MCSDRVRALAAVGVGGAAGTLLRAGAEELWPAASGHLPVATLSVNTVGAFCLGLLTGLLATAQGRSRLLRLALGTGTMGGLTTHSTFMVESERLLFGESTILGAVYLLGSVAVGLGACALGLAAGTALYDRAARRREEQ